MEQLKEAVMIAEEQRQKENWMTFSQIDINNLAIKDWEHYKQGGCLCYAGCAFECFCGAWDSESE